MYNINYWFAGKHLISIYRPFSIEWKPFCEVVMFKIGVLCLLALSWAQGHRARYDRSVTDVSTATTPGGRQLLEFCEQHPNTTGLLSRSSGQPVELRDAITVNSDPFSRTYLLDVQSHIGAQRVPERIVQAKGLGAWGYFEVTNDVSKYTSADVFNGIGKKTPLVARLAVGNPERGGSDLIRLLKTVSLKLFTKDGNLDFLTLHIPVSPFKDAHDFMSFTHAVHRSPSTGLRDLTQLFDFTSLRPATINTMLMVYSDNGVPDGWRHMNFYTVHTYELNNKHGERWYVRFNFKTDQGLRYLTNAQIREIQGLEMDYYLRDLYNALEKGKYPSWTLEMDVLSLHDVQTVNYNPFDTNRLWKNGTYHTVKIGRVVLDRNSDNQFRDQEQSAFSPANLVPGIPGPKDNIFRVRRFAYPDAQKTRISINRDKVSVNSPIPPENNYNRDGHPPVGHNMKGAPFFYPNSFNGPVPYVEEARPSEDLRLLESNAVDLQDATDIYNHYIPDDGARQRLSENIAQDIFFHVTEPARSRWMHLIKIIDKDFYHRVITAMKRFAQEPRYSHH